MTSFLARTLQLLDAPGSTYAGPQSGPAGLDLSVGEARYRIPEQVRAALAETVGAMSRLWYSDPSGDIALRQIYLQHLHTLAGPAGDISGDVLVTAGGKEAAWLAIGYLLDARQVTCALVPRPGWEPYSLWLAAAGCSQVRYDPAALAADPALLEDLIACNPTRPGLLILNYPHNPTGISITQPQMDQLLAIAGRLGVAVVSDEVYRAFGPEPVSARFAPGFNLNRDVVIDSCSKWLGVAGLRVGFLLAGADCLRAVTRFRSTYASCTSPVTQQIAATLLTSPAAARWLTAMRTDIGDTRWAVVAELAALGVTVTSHGGLYIWGRYPRPGELRVSDTSETARILPGRGFGSPQHFRLCTARADLDPTTAAQAVATTLRGT